MKSIDPIFREALSFLRNLAIVQSYKYLKIDYAHPTRVIVKASLN